MTSTRLPTPRSMIGQSRMTLFFEAQGTWQNRALLDLAAHQVVTGLQMLAQGALHTHSERQALMTLATSEKPLN